MAAVESRAHIRGGTNATSAPLDLSEQQLVDCAFRPKAANATGAPYLSDGCNGGYSDEALDYIYGNPLATEAVYPVRGGSGHCLLLPVMGFVCWLLFVLGVLWVWFGGFVCC